MKKEIKKKVKIVAQEHGYEEQSRQCMEELAELAQAVNKEFRAIRSGDPEKYEEAHQNLIEEMADALVMIMQVKHLTGIRGIELRKAMDAKLDAKLDEIWNGVHIEVQVGVVNE